ncbi:hypothetical protein QBC43DRAFT_325377 [Cladorrhinum sp. PSN259]|nr:hypothetical protein QBC43DRAFT_325377 [Cladorrhinum sp. PSN259]
MKIFYMRVQISGMRVLVAGMSWVISMDMVVSLLHALLGSTGSVGTSKGVGCMAFYRYASRMWKAYSGLFYIAV